MEREAAAGKAVRALQCPVPLPIQHASSVVNWATMPMCASVCPKRVPFQMSILPPQSNPQLSTAPVKEEPSAAKLDEVQSSIKEMCGGLWSRSEASRTTAYNIFFPKKYGGRGASGRRGDRPTTCTVLDASQERVRYASAPECPGH